MNPYRFPRRSFVRACGSAALLLPLLRNLESRAEGGAAPLRLLILHHSLGTAPLGVNWAPNVPGTTTDFVLPMESAPFEPLRSKMVMVDGLNLITATASLVTSNSGQNTHEGGMVALMTGVPTLGVYGQQDHCAGGASVDQLLLASSPLLGGPAASTQTPFGSLAQAADIRVDRDEVAPRVMSYRPPIPNPAITLARQPIYPETDALAVYQRLFGSALLDSAAMLNQKRSVLDFMRGDLARLKALAPASERDKLDVHAAAIQSLEQSLRQTYGGVPASGVCAPPAPPLSYPLVAALSGADLGGIATYESTFKGVDYAPPIAGCTPSPALSCYAHQDLALSHLRVIKAAFSCDLARVATFSFSFGNNWVMFPTTFQGATVEAWPYGGALTPHHPPSSTNTPDVQQWLAQINQFYSTLTAQILQEFENTPDLDGNNLLDNTIVVYVTEVARAWDHCQQNLPLLVFGGKNTRVDGGKYLKITEGQLGTQSGGTGNRPFNDFWLALSGVFGTEWSSLGNANQWTGPLPGVFV